MRGVRAWAYAVRVVPRMAERRTIVVDESDAVLGLDPLALELLGVVDQVGELALCDRDLDRSAEWEHGPVGRFGNDVLGVVRVPLDRHTAFECGFKFVDALAETVPVAL